MLKAWHEVDDAVSGYVAESQRQQQLQQRAEAAQAEQRLAQARQQQGLSSALPVLADTAQALEAQRELADSRARRQTALAAVYKALGED